MNRVRLLILAVAAAALGAGCSWGSNDHGDAAIDGRSSSGDSGPGSGKDGSGGQPRDAGDGGGEAAGKCPSGMRCAAIAGSFVCVRPETGVPPPCSFWGRCDVGQCTATEGGRYCIEYCAPEPVTECPAGSSCAAPAGIYVCALEDTGSPPTCEAGNACAFGACIPYQGTSYCIQPCEFPVVAECPAGYACLSLNGVFVCADPSSAAMDTCDRSEDCAHGQCVHTEGRGNCVQRCEPDAVAECADGSTCRKVTDAFVCALDSTEEPPLCDADGSCEWGECITVDGVSYCIQYCTSPLIEISGSLEDADQAPLSGVEICLLDDEQFPCVTSDEDGAFLLSELPEQDYYLLTFTLDGYHPVLRLAFPFETLDPTLLSSDEQAGAAMESANATYPETETGSIAFSAAALNDQGALEPLAGYRVILDPAADNSLGPVYATEEQTLDIWLPSASAAGWGVYYNVTPGDYQLFFGHPTLTCGGPVPLRVVAGYLSSNVSTQCQ